jgi:polysaccharide export outer membrane protein
MVLATAEAWMLNSKSLLPVLLLTAMLGASSLAAHAKSAAGQAEGAGAPAQSVPATPQSTPQSTFQPGTPTAGTAQYGAGSMRNSAMMAEESNAPAIQIGPGDLLNVVVFETPELSASVRVNQNGEANLPVLGAIRVAGLSANDAARTLEQAYKGHGLLLDPHVTVFVSEYASQGASVLGEVHAPGVYPTLGSRRLMDMLSLAGGVSPTAGKVASIIHQNDPSHPVQIAIQPTPASLHAQQNPVIQPGDTIVIAKAGVIYVIGDVLRPGGILVDNNERLSVIEALSLSGGMNKTAAMSKTKLIRKLPTGREEVDLDLKHILYGKQADVLVSDGDILFVPSSTGKTFLYRGIEAAIGLSTSYALFVH